ncbi:AAA family ATPase [Biomaibacter acetigenes]|uniref:AAA family ATPase n=1 Tax=Biomaibacter acetigenes TaxID=2316383 RepID=A0A3G2RBC7_9FIRM|nr:AAA family ATPase [Biomaibacter acetigenes]RKL63077.1 AAA family ATPase [Thermoanaerobacteraceae bacterium SP2]
MKGIPIGIDDFRDLKESNGYFVDKSLFIKEVIDDISKVKLITRPRRFGKTLNISMLRYFFEKTDEDLSCLFKDLKIWREGDTYTSQQGQYPVVNLSFKDVKDMTFDECFENIKHVIGREFRRHKYLLDCKDIDEFDKEMYTEIKNEKADKIRLKNSLYLLTSLLREYYKKDVIVLIDEYDTPINQGYICGYYEEIIDFMRNFLGGGLKGNPSLKTAVITGIYRVAKESIFSGFNNIEVSSILQNSFADKFGFTEKEVEDLLKYYNMYSEINDVKAWYNGYVFGDDTVIYNPWSILNFVKQKKLQPYWVNTSSNDIIRNIITRTGSNVKEKLQILMEGGKLKDITINTDTNFRQILYTNITSEDVLWSLLLVSGYLKMENMHLEKGRTKCDITIPDMEITVLFEDIISSWFRNREVSPDKVKELLSNLTDGDIEKFKEDFEYLVRKTFSYFDVGEDAAENFYHAFILGLLVNLDGKYRIKSNAESGDGRPDVIIIPNDPSKKGVVMEFKTAKSGQESVMEEKATDALEQISKMNYSDELKYSGVNEVVEIAIVFYRKKTYIKHNIKRI